MKSYPAVIIAGGLAKRLKPFSEHQPKSLVLIKGKPFLHYQLQLLQQQGIKDVHLLLGHLCDEVIHYLNQHPPNEITIHYHIEKKPLGTAGAIIHAFEKLPDTFFTLYGDAYLTCNYQHIQLQFLNSQKPALMTIYKNNHQWQTSNIAYNGKDIIDYDKKGKGHAFQYIDYGLSIFKKTVFTSFIDQKPLDLSVIIEALIKKQQLACHVIHTPFYEIGDIAGIKRFSEYLDAQ